MSKKAKLKKVKIGLQALGNLWNELEIRHAEESENIVVMDRLDAMRKKELEGKIEVYRRCQRDLRNIVLNPITDEKLG